MDVVKQLESQETSRSDTPKQPCRIVNCGEVPLDSWARSVAQFWGFLIVDSCKAYGSGSRSADSLFFFPFIFSEMLLVSLNLRSSLTLERRRPFVLASFSQLSYVYVPWREFNYSDVDTLPVNSNELARNISKKKCCQPSFIWDKLAPVVGRTKTLDHQMFRFLSFFFCRFNTWMTTPVKQLGRLAPHPLPKQHGVQTTAK